MLRTLYLLLLVGSLDGAVLDPAMYLMPSPPISKDSEARHLWSIDGRSLNAEPNTVLTAARENVEATSESDIFEGSETFWPGMRYPKTDVHIPLTFRLAGTYGGYGTGVVGNTYASITGLLNGQGKSGLAGSRYGSYYGNSGVRIYGGDNGPAWSGWGNGKWGHYGKG